MSKVVDEVVDGEAAVDNRKISAVGDRMKAAREALGLTQDALAKAVGGSKRGIQENETRNRVPGGEVVAGMVGLGINANWLLTGEGPMLLANLAPKPALPQVNVPALSAIIRGLIEAGAPADKVGPTAWRYYADAIEQGLITSDGIGNGGKAAA